MTGNQEVGPGFTTDEYRLNVLLRRQKSGLIIFGDINILGQVEVRCKGGMGRGGAFVREGADEKQ